MKFTSQIIAATSSILLLSGCAVTDNVVAPSDLQVRNGVIVEERPVPFYMFNVQLRAVSYSDRSTSDAWGHLQIKLIRPLNGAADWGIQYTGKIFNPAGELFDMASIYEFQEVDPRPLPFFELFSSERLSCSTIDLKGTSSISRDLVTALLANSSSFELRLGTSDLSVGDGGALAGELGATAPPEPDKVESPGGYSIFPPGPCTEAR
jgi:hypothetical protein